MRAGGENGGSEKIEYARERDREREREGKTVRENEQERERPREKIMQEKGSEKRQNLGEEEIV